MCVDCKREEEKADETAATSVAWNRTVSKTSTDACQSIYAICAGKNTQKKIKSSKAGAAGGVKVKCVVDELE